jgi:hypothetical protein
MRFSWMTDPNYLAQSSHVGWGIVATLAPAHLWGTTASLIAFAVGAVAAAAKEFWFDRRYETPPDSLRGATLDFVTYLAGGAVGLLLGWLGAHRG